MIYTVRPISDRTAFTGHSKDSSFTVTWSTALEILERELHQLGAAEIVLEVDVGESAIRLDGMLRGDARSWSPAVRLAFESKLGNLVYATDRFRKPSWRRGGMQADWQHNVYAIALGLEALRKVDRYGITKRGEQYAGWKQLPPSSNGAASHMTRDAAAELLERVAIGDEGDLRDRELARILSNPDHARLVWREARKVTHPDRRDGDQTMWDQVEQAAKVLGVLP